MFKAITKKELNKKIVYLHSYPNQIVLAKSLDGTDKWFQNGRLHKENGPAVERIAFLDSILFICKEWRFNGVLHRLDGPAIEYPGERKWYFNGCCYKNASWYYHGEIYGSYQEWLLAFNTRTLPYSNTVLRKDENQIFIKSLGNSI